MNGVRFVLLGIAGLVGVGWALVAWVSGWGFGMPDAAQGAALAIGGMAIGAAAAGRRRRPSAPGGAQEAAALRREVETLRAEIDALQASVSHDLRSPIGAVLNFLTVLEEDHGDRLDDAGRAIVARIRRSADGALALLDGLARLSRVTRRPLAPQAVDVEALVRAAFPALRPADRAVELAVAGPLPPAFGDPELLRTAFAELLANAVKFTAPREKAHVTVAAAPAPGGGVEYRVSDDGVGFDPRFAGKLFQLFERLHTRDEFPGAGAGLAVVRRIAERHGGQVRAEAEPGRGATFCLVLPAAGPEGGAAEAGR